MADDLFQQAAEKLASPSEDERKQAILVLLKLKDPRAVDLLAKLVAVDPVVDVRYYARKAYYLLRDVLPNKISEPFLELPEGVALDDLEKLLLDESPRIRGEAIKLANRLDPGSVAPFLRTALAAEKMTNLQAELLTALGRAGARYDIPSIAVFLASIEPRMRSNAINALATIGGVEALEYIVPLLMDPDSKVRADATKAVQPLGTSEMLKILRNMAMSKDAALRDSAIFTLQRYKAPMAARILAHLAAKDPVVALRDKARAGLEAMARSDENARKILEELNKPEEADDGTPATVNMDGTVPAPVKEGTPPPAPDQPQPKVLIVPGVPKKLVKLICMGDQAEREDGLRQFVLLLKPEHVPFLLLRLDKDEDPRIASHLLTLIGKTQATQAYAAVCKRFKHPDPRVVANAIEAAMQIDPNTTPDRISGFLKDRNNRIRANAIIAWATRNEFDPLAFVRDLAGVGDPAYRRSALFVIDRLKNPTFLEVLQFLILDDDMEVRHLAFKAIQEYAARGVRGAKELAETASKRNARDQKDGGKFDQDFHAAMIAMRAPPAPKKVVRKTGKSATEELGEQLLGSDGLKKAGQRVQNLKEQAKAARDNVQASLASGKWREHLPLLIGLLVLAVVFVLHAVNAVSQFSSGSSVRLISLAAAALALLTGGILAVLRRPGAGAVVALGLLLVPMAATRLDLQDADLTGGPRVVPPASATVTLPTTGPASPTTAVPPVKPPPGKTASAAPAVKTPGPTIRLLQPSRGARILGEFTIKAQVTGKPKSVEFLLDDTVLKTFEEKREGAYEFAAGSSQAHPAGRHVLKVRVIDTGGRRAEDQWIVEFVNPLAGVAISFPANGGACWRDETFAATVTGKGCEEVQFLLDGAVLAAFPADPAGRYEYPVAIATLSEGSHTFEVRAAMVDGRQASDTVTFRALVPQPTVGFTNPKNGADVFGTVGIEIAADSGWQETPIRNVTWFADGLAKKALASAPWQDSWETADLATGPHELKVTILNEIGRTAESVIRVNVIQPTFTTAIKGIRSGQVLTDDASLTVEVLSDSPGTKIDKVVLSVDDRPVQEAVAAPFGFTVRVNEIQPGPRKLAAEAFRSDGQTSRTSLSFSVNPRNRRSVFFLAQDGSGRSMTAKDLEKVRLEVKEDGKAVGSYSLQPAGEVPLCFGLLIDVSGSMKADKKLGKAKEAVSAFLDGMKPQDRAFLIRFSDTPEVVVGFTDDRGRLRQEAEFLTAKGGTALLDAVNDAVEASAQVPERTALLVLADSGDENADLTGPASTHSRDDIAEFARRNDVQIFAVGLGNLSQNALSDGEGELRILAEKTGGRYFAVPNPADLPALAGAIIRGLRDQPRLSFISPAGPPDGKWHTLEITAPDAAGLKLLYKPGYQAR